MNILNSNPENLKEEKVEKEEKNNTLSFKKKENIKSQKNENSDANFLQKTSISLIQNDINKNEIMKDKWYRTKMIKKIENKQLKLFLFDDNENEEKNYLKLYSKKENKNYTIYNERNNPIGIIKWNFLSSNFKLYDNNNKELLNMIYNLNIKGLNGPIKMKIILLKDLNFNLKDYLNNQNKNSDNEKVYLMENKIPIYNQIYKCYVLKFINRKIKTSSKNFQIIFKSNLEDNENNILLQFAETEEGFFILDYKFPFNQITAFAIGIIANSSKIFCEN